MFFLGYASNIFRKSTRNLTEDWTSGALFSAAQCWSSLPAFLSLLQTPHSTFVFVVPSPHRLEWLSGPCVHQGPWWHCCGALGSLSSPVPPLLRVRAGLPPPGHFLGWPEVPWNEFPLPSKGLHSVNKVMFLMQDNGGVYFMGTQEDWASVACGGRWHVITPLTVCLSFPVLLPPWVSQISNLHSNACVSLVPHSRVPIWDPTSCPMRFLASFLCFLKRPDSVLCPTLFLLSSSCCSCETAANKSTAFSVLLSPRPVIPISHQCLTLWKHLVHLDVWTPHSPPSWPHCYSFIIRCCSTPPWPRAWPLVL